MTESRSVLLVDDTDATRELVRMLLSRAGHRVTACEGGADALVAFEAQRFDLVLMDVEMPGMNGLETTAALREAEQQRGSGRTPVVALTGHSLPEDRDRFLAAGMDAHLAKPFRAATLYEMVTRMASPPVPPTARSTEPPLLDAEALQRLTLGDSELEAAAIAVYSRHWPAQVAALRRTVAAGDSEALRREAHGLKGAVGHFGAGAIVEAAAGLERVALPEQSSIAEQRIDEVQALLQRLQEELEGS